MAKVEKRMNELEKDIYVDEESEFAITCPYCSNEFVLECDELREEIECPECNNIIELDWGNDEDEQHDGCCGCGGCHANEDEDM